VGISQRVRNRLRRHFQGATDDLVPFCPAYILLAGPGSVLSASQSGYLVGVCALALVRFTRNWQGKRSPSKNFERRKTALKKIPDFIHVENCQ